MPRAKVAPGLSGERVVRYREQSFHASTGELELEEQWDPPKLHIDDSAEHVALGASWLEVYEETKLPTDGEQSTETARDRWTMIAEDESVTVPAGTFRALVLRKAGGSSSKTYWYVRGIGKVKEIGGQTEELATYGKVYTAAAGLGESPENSLKHVLRELMRHGLHDGDDVSHRTDGTLGRLIVLRSNEPQPVVLMDDGTQIAFRAEDWRRRGG